MVQCCACDPGSKEEEREHLISCSGPPDAEYARGVESRDWGSCGEFRDLPFAILFIANTVVLFTLLAVNYDGAHFKRLMPSGASTTGSLHAAVWAVVLAVMWGLCMSIGWLLALRACPYALVVGGLGLSILVPITMAIVFFAQSQWLGAGLSALIAALALGWAYCIRARIPLAASMLRLSSSFLWKHWSLLAIASTSLLVQVGYLAAWSAAFLVTMQAIGVTARQQEGSDADPGLAWGTAFYFLLTYYWTSNVFSNVVHVTCAGAFADWWIGAPLGVLGGSRNKALKSLARDGNNREESSPIQFLRCCVACLLSCIEDMLDFLNTYAFVHVAIYGSDFCLAGASAWEIIRMAGFDMIINQDLTSMALAVSAFGGSVGAGVTVYFVTIAVGSATSTAVALSVFGGIICFTCVMLMMSLVTSCVASIYVLYCEMPAQGAANHPEEINALTTAWQEAYHDFRWQRQGNRVYSIETIDARHA